MAHEHGSMHWNDLNWEKTSYSRVGAYNQSKLANVLHAKELARRLKKDGVSVYALHPGVINSELTRHFYDTCFGKMVKPVYGIFTKTPKQGAQTTLYCCLEPKIAKDSGNYYSGCKEKRAAKKARDVDSQKRLWEISEKMVGLK